MSDRCSKCGKTRWYRLDPTDVYGLYMCSDEFHDRPDDKSPEPREPRQSGVTPGGVPYSGHFDSGNTVRRLVEQIVDAAAKEVRRRDTTGIEVGGVLPPSLSKDALRPTTDEVEAACAESESWRKCLSDDLHHDVAGNHIPCPWCSAEHGHTSTCLASRVITSGRNTEATLRARIEALTAERDALVTDSVRQYRRAEAAERERDEARALAQNIVCSEEDAVGVLEQRVAVLEAVREAASDFSWASMAGATNAEYRAASHSTLDAALAAAEESE